MLLSISDCTLSIWLYRDCYLRFSSQEFTIDDLRESIHLTNNSVQKRYKNKPNRDMRLPKNNMWSLEQFKVYLKHSNAPDNIWEERIYPGFKENLIAVVMASLEETDFVENSFELYGCDLMLDEQYNPILIEINSTPDLSPSTDVTARICPLALKDLVKVIVDLPRNPLSPTGNFERVYEVNYKIKRDFDPEVGLDICGKAMTLFKQTMIPQKKTPIRLPTKLIKKTEHAIKVPLKRLRGPAAQVSALICSTYFIFALNAVCLFVLYFKNTGLLSYSVLVLELDMVFLAVVRLNTVHFLVVTFNSLYVCHAIVKIILKDDVF